MVFHTGTLSRSIPLSSVNTSRRGLGPPAHILGCGNWYPAVIVRRCSEFKSRPQTQSPAGLSLRKGVVRTTSSTTVVTAAAWEPILSALQAQFSVSTVVTALAGVVAVGVGFAFMWWGVRKAMRIFFKSAKGGKVSV